MKLSYVLITLLFVATLAVILLYAGNQGSFSTITHSTTPVNLTSKSLTVGYPETPKVERKLIELSVNDSVINFKEVVNYAGVGTLNSCKEVLPDAKTILLKEVEMKYLRRVTHGDVKILCLPNGELEINFRVYGKVWVSEGEQYADFLWFLTPNNLDFIDNRFTELKDGLKWSGILDGTPTSIVIHLPPQETAYVAWGEPVGHCHGHVWWPAKSTSK